MGDAKGMPEENISGRIRYCVDVIASCTCCILSNKGQSISCALITCSLPSSCTNCMPGHLSTAPCSSISDVGQKLSFFCTLQYLWYLWDDIKYDLTTNHLIPVHSAAIRDNQAHSISASTSSLSTKFLPTSQYIIQI